MVRDIKRIYFRNMNTAYDFGVVHETPSHDLGCAEFSAILVIDEFTIPPASLTAKSPPQKLSVTNLNAFWT